MKRKLTKSPNNVVLTGSLAGIADWLGIDPTIIRVVYVLLSFFSAGFPGILLYIAFSSLDPFWKNRKRSRLRPSKSL